VETDPLVTDEIKASFEKVVNSSEVFDEKNEAHLPKYDYHGELLPGSLLGMGGFCNVSEIIKITLSKKDDPNSEARSHMANNYLRDGDARYAIKKLRDDLSDADKSKGILDLALEAKFLSVIDHPHIIKIRGFASAEHLSTDFFVILDRLYNTLAKQFVIWGEKKKKMSTTKAKLLDRKGKKKKDLLVEQLNCAYDIAGALDHLHKHNIIYRDLSPDNVGFDVRGQVKIFDFGLAKELLPSMKMADGRYKLTGCTGSLRFMAPEVVLCEPYNTSADAFSFGILLWQNLSLTMPYQNFTIKMYVQLVGQKGYRPQDPNVKEDWPADVGALMKNCWDQQPVARPSLEDAKNKLGNIIMEQSTGLKVELDLDMSKRSKHGSKFNQNKTENKDSN